MFVCVDCDKIIDDMQLPSQVYQMALRNLPTPVFESNV